MSNAVMDAGGWKLTILNRWINASLFDSVS